MAVKATKTDDIIDRLNVLAKGKPSEFELRHVKREIDQIKSSDVVCFHMLTGILHSVSGVYDLSKESHEKSLSLSSSSIVLLMNYGLSMCRLARYRDGLDILLEAFALEPNSVAIATEVFRAMIYSGNFAEFDGVLERLAKANPGLDFYQVDGYSRIHKIKEDLNRAGVPESEYALAMSMVQSVLIAQGYRFPGIMISGGSFDGVHHVSTRLAVPVSDYRELSRLNDLITETVIAEERLTCWDRMVFTASVLDNDQDLAPVKSEDVA